MTKKNRKDKTEKREEQESARTEPEDIEQVPAGEEADASASGEAESSSNDDSTDDLLADVRKSLVEDEKQDRKPKSSWWTPRVKKEEPEEPVVEVEPIPDPVVEQEQADEYVDQIDQLIDMLDEESPSENKPNEIEEIVPESVVEPETEPETPLNVEELKKRAFSARENETGEDISEVRSVALDGAEDVFVEVEASRVDTRQDSIKSFENAIRPYRQYIYFVVAFLAFVVIALVSMTMYAVYQRSRPPEVAPTFDPNLPYPVTLALPGGLNFALGKGVISDGKWNPRGPEWLQGTEVCRWVAIPWSTQLEAVVRTLTQEDTIELVMNNGDKLTYTVNSRREMTLDEMQAIDQNSPCLLLILAKQESDTRLVVIAHP